MVIALSNAHYVPQHQHSLVVVCQMTHSCARPREYSDIKKCTWVDGEGIVFSLTYNNIELYGTLNIYQNLGKQLFTGWWLLGL